MGRRKGAQTPSVWITQPYKKTPGSEAQEAIDAYELTGRKVLPWQKKQITAILATDKKGGYKHRRYGFAVPRRNGKTEIFLMRELYALKHGESVLHTAHLSTTSSDAAARLAEVLTNSGYEEVVKKKKGETYRHHFTYRKQFGLEVIALLCEGGGVVRFRTRTSRGGLGQKCDCLIIDEAQEYLTEQEDTLKYLVSDSKNRQILLCGTPPTAVSLGDVFKRLREECVAGKPPKYTGWAEWSVPEQCDPHDRAAWYAANPSLGYVFDEDAVELEITGDALDFNIQRLGFWTTYNLRSAISSADWEQTIVDQLPQLTGATYAGIKFGKDGENVSLAIACRTTSGDVFVSAYDTRPIRLGTGWIVDYLAKIPTLDRIVIDGAGQQLRLAEELKEAKVKTRPLLPKVAEVIRANADFEQAVYNGGIVHMPQQTLDEAVTACEKRPIGSNGGFGYKSIAQAVDIVTMDSAILAFWACLSAKEKKAQKIRY